ncbi:MAG: hypothetical protein ABIG66_04100 [Candidatus Kerfeldbacteria bacterium]
MKWEFSVVPVAKAILFALPFVVLIWLLGQYFSFFGELSVTHDFRYKSPVIGEFQPVGRALDREKNLKTGDAVQRIVGDPVYFSATVPRSFDSVDLELGYANPDQQLIELGIVTSEEPWNVRLYQFENKVIDEAMAEWESVESNGTVLLQREPTFGSVEEFTANLPLEKRIGTQNVTLEYEYRDDLYEVQEEDLLIDRMLRGRHEFLVYGGGEDIHIEFDIADLNTEDGEDPVKIEIHKDGVLIHEELLPDDGVTDASSGVLPVRTLAVNIPAPGEGLFRIVASVNNDIVIKQIRTRQHKFVMNKNAYIINNAEYDELGSFNTDPTSLVFQGRKLMLRTEHSTGVQTAEIDGSPFAVEEVNTPFWWDQDEPKQCHSLTLPKNDLVLSTTGVFAFSPESFFDPDYFIDEVDETTSIDDFDYIIVRDYLSPATDAEGMRQSVHIPLDGVAGDRKELLFVLSAPGIERNHYTLQLHEINLLFHREPLTTRITDFFK